MIRKIKEKFDDILLLVGLAMVCYGLWQIYPPLAWLVGGAALAGIGFLNARYAAGDDV